MILGMILGALIVIGVVAYAVKTGTKLSAIESAIAALEGKVGTEAEAILAKIKAIL